MAFRMQSSEAAGGDPESELDLAALDEALARDETLLEETAEARPVPTAEGPRCPLCGWPNPEDARRCAGCDIDLRDGSPPPFDRFRPPLLDRRWIAAGAVLLVLAALGFGIRAAIRAGADRRALLRGERELAAGRLEPARRAFEQATRYRSDNAAAWAALADTLARLGRLEEARAAVQRAERFGARDNVHTNLATGRILLAEGRAQQALAALRAAHERRPSLGSVLHLLGDAYAALGDEPAALAHYEQALREDPDAPEAPHSRLALAALALHRSRLDQAEALLAAARTDPGADRLALALLEGELHRRRGERLAAVQSFREAVRLAPGAAEPAFRLARALRELKLPGQALEALRPALAEAPTSTAYRRLEADLLLDLERPHEAEQRYLALGQRPPGDAAALTAAARIALRDGRTEAAHKRLAQALAVDPAYAPAALALARLALERKDPERAIAVLRAALERDPLAVELRTELGRALLAAGRRDEAAVALEVAVQSGADTPAAARARRLLADLYRADGNLPAALRHLEALAAQRPDDRALQFERVAWLLEAGRREQAARVLETIAPRWPDAPELARLRAALTAPPH
ncbi:MAG: tetratricopeptide repeat protein [Planctomycetota bacterium]|nr:MAG: tetratricopeptide repeat protein [Planctomycetota bacterium]